mgnify:FL=1
MRDKVLNSSSVTFSSSDSEVKALGEHLRIPQIIGQLDKQLSLREQIEKIVESMNQFVSASSTHVKFELHEKLNDYYVTVINSETNDVIKEIPSKKTLDVYASMLEYMGILVDKKV